ncbi:MAG: monovalent cation/H+ antiporter subunit D family protein [Pseudomonadota bacterium]
MSAQLPILVLIWPLVAAPLCTLLNNRSAAWLLSAIATWASLLSAIGLYVQTSGGAELIYELGGWAPPWGISVNIDSLNALVLLLITGMASVLVFAFPASRTIQWLGERARLYYTAYLLCFTSLIGITITGDAFNVFVFLEISSLSTYALVAMGRDRRAQLAAFRYLIMGTLGATFILISVGLLYMVTGTLNMADLAERLPAMQDNRVVRAAFGFFVIGAGVKVAMFPMHFWLPGAYSYAPSIASAFLAATATKVAVYVMLRFVFGVFGAELFFETLALDQVFLMLATIGIVVGSLAALYQDDIKAVLAYSSVAQLAYMVLGIAVGSESGLTAAIVHIFNHGLIKAALFIVLAGIFVRFECTKLSEIAGLGKRAPWTVAAFGVGAMSLIGIPGTAGFISKWYLLLSVLEHHWWFVALVIIGSSLLALAYMWRVIDALWLREPTQLVEERGQEAPLNMLLPAWALAAANFFFGIDTTVTLGAASRAVASLLGAGA